MSLFSRRSGGTAMDSFCHDAFTLVGQFQQGPNRLIQVGVLAIVLCFFHRLWLATQLLSQTLFPTTTTTPFTHVAGTMQKKLPAISFESITVACVRLENWTERSIPSAHGTSTVNNDFVHFIVVGAAIIQIITEHSINHRHLYSSARRRPTDLGAWWARRGRMSTPREGRSSVTMASIHSSSCCTTAQRLGRKIIQ